MVRLRVTLGSGQLGSGFIEAEGFGSGWAQGWFKLRVTLGSPLQTQENCSASITPNQNPDPVLL